MNILPLAGAASMIAPRTHRIILQNLEVEADIGFHAFEIGNRQRLLLSVEVTLNLEHWPRDDSRDSAWDYDFIRNIIRETVAARRFNLQETLIGEIFRLIAERPGVEALTVSSRKPDVYPDAGAVGVTLSSE